MDKDNQSFGRCGMIGSGRRMGYCVEMGCGIRGMSLVCEGRSYGDIWDRWRGGLGRGRRGRLGLCCIGLWG